MSESLQELAALVARAEQDAEAAERELAARREQALQPLRTEVEARRAQVQALKRDLERTQASATLGRGQLRRAQARLELDLAMAGGTLRSPLPPLGWRLGYPLAWGLCGACFALSVPLLCAPSLVFPIAFFVGRSRRG